MLGLRNLIEIFELKTTLVFEHFEKLRLWTPVRDKLIEIFGLKNQLAINRFEISKNQKTKEKYYLDGEKMDKKPKKLIHEGHRERLRESVDKDPELDTFSDYATLEYLLSFFIPRKDTNVIAHELIDSFGSFYGVLSANPDELFQIKNMTMKAAHFLPNLIAVVRKAEISRQKRSSYVGTVSDSVAAFRPYFIGRNSELLYMMMLDINDRIISIDCLSKGVANFTAVDMSAIAAKTSRSQACKIILAHNHPGGNLSPSNEDIKATSSISLLMNSMGKELVDHLIFVGDDYYSFYEGKNMTQLIQNADKVLGTNKSKEVQSRLFVDRYVLESGGGHNGNAGGFDFDGNQNENAKYNSNGGQHGNVSYNSDGNQNGNFCCNSGGEKNKNTSSKKD